MTTNADHTYNLRRLAGRLRIGGTTFVPMAWGDLEGAAAYIDQLEAENEQLTQEIDRLNEPVTS